MKTQKYSCMFLLILNIIIVLLATLLFTFNQICNLRFLGLWIAWNLSGYAFALLVGPITCIISFLLTLTVCCSYKYCKKHIVILSIIITTFIIILNIIGFIPRLDIYTWK